MSAELLEVKSIIVMLTPLVQSDQTKRVQLDVLMPSML